MRRAIFLVAGATLLASTGLAGKAAAGPAGPCATFQVFGTNLDLDYNPFSPQPLNRPFLLTVTRQNPAVTSVRFILVDNTPSEGRSRIGPAGPFDYTFTWLANAGQPVFFTTPLAVNPAIGADVSFGSGPSGNVQTAPFILHIPQGQPVAASTQFENIEVIYQCSIGSSPQMQQIQYDNRVSIHLDIPRYFGAYIGSPGRSHGEIDFGTLGAAGGFDDKYVSVTAVSTVPYSIAFASENGLALRRHEHDPDGIPYTMKFANVAVTDKSMLRCPMTQSSLGDSEPLDVKLDGSHVHDLEAGSYRDTITLTFTPIDGPQRTQSCALE
jgi:hypothetical protein